MIRNSCSLATYREASPTPAATPHVQPGDLELAEDGLQSSTLVAKQRLKNPQARASYALDCLEEPTYIPFLDAIVTLKVCLPQKVLFPAGFTDGWSQLETGRCGGLGRNQAQPG